MKAGVENLAIHHLALKGVKMLKQDALEVKITVCVDKFACEHF